MLKIYVDESGNLGTQGRYFVIGAFCTESGKRIRNIIKKHCAKQAVTELKHRFTSFEDRQKLAYKFKTVVDHKTGYICVDKTKIISPHLKADNNLLFNYAFSYLMRDIVKYQGSQDIKIIVDNRNQKVGSVNSLGDYLRIKAYTEWNFTHHMDTVYVDSESDRLVQAADFVAGATLERYKNNKTHVYNILQPDYPICFPNTHFNT